VLILILVLGFIKKKRGLRSRPTKLIIFSPIYIRQQKQNNAKKMTFTEETIKVYLDDLENHWEDLNDIFIHNKNYKMIETKSDWWNDVIYITTTEYETEYERGYYNYYIDINLVYSDYKIRKVIVEDNEWEWDRINNIKDEVDERNSCDYVMK
jgi:hypothetical protein